MPAAVALVGSKSQGIHEPGKSEQRELRLQYESDRQLRPNIASHVITPWGYSIVSW